MSFFTAAEEWSSLVTSGSQDGLSRVFEAILDDDSAIVVEDPVYPGAVAALKHLPGERVAVRCDNFGIIPERVGKGNWQCLSVGCSLSTFAVRGGIVAALRFGKGHQGDLYDSHWPEPVWRYDEYREKEGHLRYLLVSLCLNELCRQTSLIKMTDITVVATTFSFSRMILTPFSLFRVSTNPTTAKC